MKNFALTAVSGHSGKSRVGSADQPPSDGAAAPDSGKGVAFPGGLHIVWTLPFADSVAVHKLRDLLAEGVKAELFSLVSWKSHDGRVSAVLAPKAPLEAIADLIWSTGQLPAGLWLEALPSTTVN